MKKLIATIIISVFITFIITENYMLSTMQVNGNPGSYTVSVFGSEFYYK